MVVVVVYCMTVPLPGSAVFFQLGALLVPGAMSNCGMACLRWV